MAAVTEQPVVADRDAQSTSKVPDDKQNRFDPGHAIRRRMPPQTENGSDGCEHEEECVDDVDLVAPVV